MLPTEDAHSSMAELTPWGFPPTPLLPRWYREKFAKSRLPKAVRRANPSLKTVGELEAYWEEVQTPVDKDLLASLVHLIGGRQPPKDYVVIPAGFGHQELLEYPLRRRTANVLHDLHRKGLLDGDQDLTVRVLMSAWSFGIKSLVDLMCVSEIALTDSLVAPSEDSSYVSNHSIYPTPKWAELVDHLDALLSAASEFHDAETVGQALRLDLFGLGSTVGVSTELESLKIRDLTRRGRIADTVVKRLSDLQKSMDSRELLIVERRLCTSRPEKMQDLGRLIGVSRERVRQLEQAVRKKIEELVGVEVGILGRFLGEQMGPVVDAAELDTFVAEMFAASHEKQSIQLAIGMVRTDLNYSCVNGVCLDKTAVEVADGMKEMVATGGDDVGLVDEQALRGQLPSEDWGSWFYKIVQACGFFHFGNWIAARDTVPARAKAALLKLGRPASAEEVAEVSGLEASQVRVQFRQLSSVARASKMHWGLPEWIDDEYEGIPTEIIQRINEDGGATPLARLVEELPRLFGVSESSVRVIAATGQFAIRDGYVSMADETSIDLRELDDVIDGRTATGEAYWTFRVESRYLEGHSLLRFPAELAKVLGCKPNGKARVTVYYPTQCRDLSISWRLSSPTGASLGYLSDPLRQLGTSEGDHIRLILKHSGGVELHPELGEGTSQAGAVTPRGESGSSILERIKRRRAVT